MAKGLVEQSTMTAIADAIRAKGVTGNFKPAEMAGAISAIVTGGGGSVEYVPTTFTTIPGRSSKRYMITFGTYSYSQNFSLLYEFKEPTTKEYYVNCVTNTGISHSYLTFDNGSRQDMAMGYTNQIKPFAIPVGTTTVKIDFENYSSYSYVQWIGAYIGESPIQQNTNVNSPTNYWKLVEPIDDSMFSTNEYTASTNDETKVLVETEEIIVPEQITVETAGYLKVTVNDTEYTIYEAEGGSY